MKAVCVFPVPDEAATYCRVSERVEGKIHYDGAHDSVHRFVKSWRDERARVPVHAYVPMSFAPGEAYQFDWSQRDDHPPGSAADGMVPLLSIMRSVTLPILFSEGS